MRSYKQKCKNIKYSDDYTTPKDIYKYYVLDRLYYDPCPLFAKGFIFEQFSDWPVFLNPPYSDITIWINWAIENHKRYSRHIVILIPSRTDTKYFHKLLNYGVDLEFIKGRLKFNGMKTGAPFPSVLVHIKGVI